uniref:Uncharacterized protein n=1 Tax=Physcomitrium patens TaxID=3218 RepID=A0A2K1L279_PHYPA|nr:hypothetical protein PHYPA_002931 [Physcomitrium patens]
MFTSCCILLSEENRRKVELFRQIVRPCDLQFTRYIGENSDGDSLTFKTVPVTSSLVRAFAAPASANTTMEVMVAGVVTARVLCSSFTWALTEKAGRLHLDNPFALRRETELSTNCEVPANEPLMPSTCIVFIVWAISVSSPDGTGPSRERKRVVEALQNAFLIYDGLQFRSLWYENPHKLIRNKQSIAQHNTSREL